MNGSVVITTKKLHEISMKKQNVSNLCSEMPCDVLKDMFLRGTSKDLAGREVPCKPALTWPNVQALYKTISLYKPSNVLEVGMAFGTSSLAILSALKKLGQNGRLISIDPSQTTAFAAQGIINVQHAGLQDLHELIEECDFIALPTLLKQSKKFDFIYIDGWHTIDYVLLDIFYCDKLLKPGGIMAFNDCGWRAVHKALNFLKTHHHYKEIDVGLRRDFSARNPLFKVIKMIEGRSIADRYFEKVEDWEPPSNFFARF